MPVLERGYLSFEGFCEEGSGVGCRLGYPPAESIDDSAVNAEFPVGDSASLVVED